MRFRRFTAAAATVVAAFALTACGGDDGGSTGGTVDGGGSSGGTAAVGASLTKANFSEEVSQATSDANSVHMEGDVSAQGQSFTMSGDVEVSKGNLEDTSMSMTMEGAGQEMEMLLVDGVMYMKADRISKDPSKPWVSIDLTDPSNPFGSMYKQLMANADPSQLAKSFEALTEVKKVGEEDVDGVEATHYTVTVDVKEAVKAMGLTDSLGPDAESMLQSLPKSTAYEVWVTDDALPARMSMNMMGTDMDLRFSDWGEDVSVEAPPSGEVSEFSL
jgi:hypothetical protein